MKHKGIVNKRTCEGCIYCSRPILMGKDQVCCELRRLWKDRYMPRWCKSRVEKGQHNEG